MQKYSIDYKTMSLIGGAYAATGADLGTPLNGSAAFTLDAWIRFHGLCSQSVILEKPGQFSLSTNGRWIFAELSGYPALSTAGGDFPLTAEEWHYITVTWTGVTMMIYLDGQLVRQAGLKGTPAPDNSEPVTIGQNLQGEFYSLRLWDLALPAEKIKKYQFMPVDQEGSDYSHLAACFDFSVSPPQDTTPNANPVTLEDGAKTLISTPSVWLGDTAYCQPIRDEDQVNPAGGGNDSYSIQAWVNVQYTVPNQQVIFVNSNLEAGSGMAFYLSYDTDAEVFRLVSQRGDGSAGKTLTSTRAVPPKAWTYLATTYDGPSQTLSLYIGGELDSSTVTGPIPSQDEGMLLIGAGLVEDKPSGAMCLQGYLASVQVWNRALTAQEIQDLAQSDNVLEEGLTGLYSFTDPPARNQINGNPVGLCDGAKLLSMKRTEALTGEGSLTPADLEPARPPAWKPLELDAERIQKLRDSVDWDEARERAGLLTAAMEADLDERTIRKYIPSEQIPGFREKIRERWEEVIRTAREDPRALGLLTWHEVDGYRVLLRHLPEGSQVVYSAPADTLDDCTMWKISVLWTEVSGMLSIFGIYSYLSTQATTFINDRILANEAVMEAIYIGTSPGAFALWTVLQKLYSYGLLWPLVKIILKTMTWWALGRLALKIAACFLGAEAAEIVASLIIAVAQLIYVLLQKPDDCSWD